MMFTFPGGIGHVLVTRHGFGPHSWHLDRKWLHLLIPPLLCIPCLWATVWGYFQVHGEACGVSGGDGFLSDWGTWNASCFNDRHEASNWLTGPALFCGAMVVSCAPHLMLLSVLVGCNVRPHRLLRTKSYLSRSGAEEDSDKRDANNAAAVMIQAMWRGKQARALQAWEHKAMSEEAVSSPRRRLFFWLSTMVLLILNFWAQNLFVLHYLLNANSPSDIRTYTIVLSIGQSCFKILGQQLIVKAERESIGLYASFARMTMANATRFMFLCYGEVYKQLLFANIKSWDDFWTLYTTDLSMTLLGQCLPMSSAFNRWDKAQPWYRRCSRRCGGVRIGPDVSRIMVKQDIFHQRGVICFDAYLRDRAITFAKAQYLLLLLFFQAVQVFPEYLPDNTPLFPVFSPENKEFDAWMQIQFTIFGLLANTVIYTIVSVQLASI